MSAAQFAADYFGSTVGRDISGLFLGEQLGRGQYRQVFEWLPDKNLVLKVETDAGCFSNVMEWEVWQRMKSTAHAKWFAPVERISGCGIALLQRRTKPIPARRLPRQVPAFFSDLKQSNWGLLNGRPVCHDYGNNLLLDQGMSKRAQTPKWHLND